MSTRRLMAASKALRDAVKQCHASSPYVGNTVDEAERRLHSLGFATCPVAEAVADALDFASKGEICDNFNNTDERLVAVADRILSGGDPG